MDALAGSETLRIEVRCACCARWACCACSQAPSQQRMYSCCSTRRMLRMLAHRCPMAVNGELRCAALRCVQVVTQGEHRSSSKSLRQGTARLIAALRQVGRALCVVFSRPSPPCACLCVWSTCPSATANSFLTQVLHPTPPEPPLSFPPQPPAYAHPPTHPPHPLMQGKSACHLSVPPHSSTPYPTPLFYNGLPAPTPHPCRESGKTSWSCPPPTHSIPDPSVLHPPTPTPNPHPVWQGKWEDQLALPLLLLLAQQRKLITLQTQVGWCLGGSGVWVGLV